jgi:hypothetical protein
LKVKNSNLKCPPDHIRKNDSIWTTISEPENYGYLFKKVAATEKYYDKWSGIIYSPENFCYKYYDNITGIPNNLENLSPEDILIINDDEIDEYNLNDNKYVIIKRNETNYNNIYSPGCKTENGKMLFTFEEKIPTSGNTIDFYFSISNPYDTERTFHFETHSVQFKIYLIQVPNPKWFPSYEEECNEFEEYEI